MMYLPDDADNDAIDVFATKAGAGSNPDWSCNLTALASATSNAAPEMTGTGVHATVIDLRGQATASRLPSQR